MENAKQKAIRLAYGLYWEQMKDYVDENGYCDKNDLFHNEKIRYEEIDLDFIHCVDFTMIPKPLQGIENNNGWIRIESEKDLPSDDCDYWVKNADGEIVEMEYFSKYKSFTEEDVTHYQPIVKPLKPIY